MTPLRQRMIEDMRLRNLAPNTQEAYVRAVAKLAQHFGKSPELLSKEEVRSYLVYLVQEKHASTDHYVHRVAISNKRLLDVRDGQVRFQYKDYADGNKTKAMTLDAMEFIRRFLMHVLPSGFMRIRHYGFIGNRHRQAKLDLCRRLLGAESVQETAKPCDPSESDGHATERDVHVVCPACGKGRMLIIETFHPEAKATPVRRPFFMQRLALRAKPDTS